MVEKDNEILITGCLQTDSVKKLKD